MILSEGLFTFTNSVDPDGMQHFAPFHLDLHCLQKCLLRSFETTKGLQLSLFGN